KRIEGSSPEDEEFFSIKFENEDIQARAGDTVAAALLACGVLDFRTSAISGSCRGPWCMMGICFECLVAIDNAPNCQACQVIVRPGMQIRRQQGARRIDV